MLFDEMNVIKKLRQNAQQKHAKTVVQLKKQKRQNIAQTQKMFDLQSRLIDIENQVLFNQAAVNDLARQKMKMIRMRRCKNQHRSRKNELVEKIKTLRLDKAVFEKKILKFINKQSRQSDFIDDFDQEDFRTETKRQNFERDVEMIELLSRNSLRKFIIFSQKRVFEHVHESIFSDEQSLATRVFHEHKIKYQNIFNFYEDHDE